MGAKKNLIKELCSALKIVKADVNYTKKIVGIKKGVN